MKRAIRAGLSFLIVGIMCCSMTACEKKYRFTYVDGSYKAKSSASLFSMSWDMLSISSDMDETLEEELPKKKVKFVENKLTGLFKEDVEMEIADENDEGEVEEAVFDCFNVEFSEWIDTYGVKYETEGGTAYFVPYYIECEVTDGELYVEAMICSEDATYRFDDENTYLVTFSFELDA